MRTWLVPGRGLLVEWEPDERHHADRWNPLFDPAAGRVEATWLYYLLDDAGEVRSTYASRAYSLEDDLSLWGHAVVGDRLMKYSSTHNANHGTSRYRAQVELQALQPVARDAGSLGGVREAVERHRARLAREWAEERGRIESVHSSFRDALLACGVEGSRLIIDLGRAEPEAPRPWVVRTPEGRVIWQTSEWRYWGEDLYRGLRKIARELGSELKPNPELYSEQIWTCD